MKYKKVLKQKKGVAGLEVLLSIISMLFMIGIIIMVFVIGGTKLEETVSTGDFLDSTTVANEVGAYSNETGYTLAGASSYNAESFAITGAWNETSGVAIALANFSVSSTGVVTNASILTYEAVNFSYTYNYLQDMSSAEVINDTYTSLGSTTDWFPTFIILGAMIVLVLLVVIIITSIKRSGITEGA